MISNSSPLICLAKINQLELLKKLFQKIIITDEVKKEVLVFEKSGYKEVEMAIEEKWIIIENPKNNLDLKLGVGENSIISLASEKKDSLIIDDLKGIKISRSFNIPIFRTTDVIAMALDKNVINKKQAISLINMIMHNGYHISHYHYTKIIELIENL